MYQKLFYTWQKLEKEQQKRDREIGKHKLNEMGALNMKLKKWKKLEKSKRASHRPGVPKHDAH